MKKTNPVLALGFFALALALLLTSVDFWCFQPSFYAEEYEKYQNAATIGMSQDDLNASTTVLLDYLQDKRDDLVLTAEVQGTQREVFNDREKTHMADVKVLYQRAMMVRNVSLGLVIIAIVVFFWKKRPWTSLIPSALVGFGIFGGLMVALGVYALADFNSFWTSFHQVLFSNDLWLLDPNTSILVNMVPEGFFNDLVLRILATFFGGLLVVGVLVGLGGKKKNDSYRSI